MTTLLTVILYTLAFCALVSFATSRVFAPVWLRLCYGRPGSYPVNVPHRWRVVACWERAFNSERGLRVMFADRQLFALCLFHAWDGWRAMLVLPVMYDCALGYTLHGRAYHSRACFSGSLRWQAYRIGQWFAGLPDRFCPARLPWEQASQVLWSDAVECAYETFDCGYPMPQPVLEWALARYTVNARHYWGNDTTQGDIDTVLAADRARYADECRPGGYGQAARAWREDFHSDEGY